jgi:hypothetical protein
MCQVIFSTERNAYWSSEFGWTTQDRATRYSVAERDAQTAGRGLPLPEGGAWHHEEEG